MKNAKYVLMLALGALGAAGAVSSAPSKPAAKTTPKTTPKTALVVVGRVKAFTRPPRPRSVPYKDAIIALHLTGVKAQSGRISSQEIVVFAWGMRNNQWTPAASYRAGQVVRLQLAPWEKMERKYGNYNRFELEGKAVWDLDTYWGEAK